MATSDARPPHPGQTLQRLFMDPNGLSVNRLARALGVPANRISAIMAGQRPMTADTALRLARLFETSALYWMNLQARYDLAMAEQVLGPDLEERVRPLSERPAESFEDTPPEDLSSDA